MRRDPAGPPARPRSLALPHAVARTHAPEPTPDSALGSGPVTAAGRAIRLDLRPGPLNRGTRSPPGTAPRPKEGCVSRAKFGTNSRAGNTRAGPPVPGQTPPLRPGADTAAQTAGQAGTALPAPRRPGAVPTRTRSCTLEAGREFVASTQPRGRSWTPCLHRAGHRRVGAGQGPRWPWNGLHPASLPGALSWPSLFWEGRGSMHGC